MVLNSILLPQHPENESIFPELMTMIHDLRTLNTLHTEKFLQQCKINEQNVPSANGNSASSWPVNGSVPNPMPGCPAGNAVAAAVNNNNQNNQEQGAHFEAAHQRWDSAHLDRESTGNGTPQSSSGGDTHSSTSLEDTSSRRSPMGSVSSTDSSNSDVSKMINNVQDLRMNGNSVLMTALTSQSGVTISRKSSSSSGPLTTHCPMAATVSTVSVTSANVNNLKYNQMRKTDSPSTDSGVESNILHPTSSTNNSVCSSPRSSSESETKSRSTSSGSSTSGGSSASPPSEERHPLLKRALQQPPQMFNNVNTFQDEVYKPHKKFRRHNNSFSKDYCPSSSTQRSSSPEAHQPRSLLASQLSEPPAYHHPVAQPPARSSSAGPVSGILASTLREGIPLATEQESKRNEFLASIILGDGLRDGHRGAEQLRQPQVEPRGSHAIPQGLLMCASTTPRHIPPSQVQTPGNRHIPVAVLPTKPGALRPAPSATVTSEVLDLSKRTNGQDPAELSSAEVVRG